MLRVSPSPLRFSAASRISKVGRCDPSASRRDCVAGRRDLGAAEPRKMCASSHMYSAGDSRAAARAAWARSTDSARGRSAPGMNASMPLVKKPGLLSAGVTWTFF
jgi:hypothetical protein